MFHATEAGHWYRKDGTPCYEIEGRNGKLRRTTIRDARKLDLVPSVTTILRAAAAPGLERWKQRQILMAAATLPKVEGEDADQWVERVLEDAGKEAEAARERGTDIHALLQRYFQEPLMCSPEETEIGSSVQAVLGATFGDLDWIAEDSFATTSPLPYGGKVDLYSKDPAIVVDFKGKDPKALDSERQLAWPEQAMQLAAYAHGLGIPQATLANVFFDRDDPRHCRLHVWDTGPWWLRFSCLLRYWHLDKGLFL